MKKKKTSKKTNNTMNIGKLMHKYAPRMNISPSAIEAMIDRIDMFLQLAMPEIVEIAKANGCIKTIKEYEDIEHPEKSQAHITLYFGFIDNNVKDKLEINNAKSK